MEGVGIHFDIEQKELVLTFINPNQEREVLVIPNFTKGFDGNYTKLVPKEDMLKIAKAFVAKL
jgi:hypothetical protein